MTTNDNTKPYAREEAVGEAGKPYIQEWRCTPPLLGKLYRVAPGGAEWSTDEETGLPLRIVHEVIIL